MRYFEGNQKIPEKIRLAPNDMLMLKSDQYTVQANIGKGGFAHVYSVQNSAGRVLALKLTDLWLIRPDEYEFVECKFRQEFQTGRINSNYIVQNHYTGHIVGNPYIIMDYCPNGSLSSRLHEFNDEHRFTQLGVAILNGLEDLHREGIVHRDLKPENVLFDVADNPKLSDFGIAGHLNKRLTSRNFIGMVSQVWGTPLYSPPEQLDHSKAYKLTAPTMDIFSFGVLMYEVISGGKHPFGDHQELMDKPAEYVKRVNKNSIIPLNHYVPGLPGHWDTIIRRCLSPKPKDRYASAAEILRLIELPRDRNIHLDVSPNHDGDTLSIIQGEAIGQIYPLDEIRSGSDQPYIRIGWLDTQNKWQNEIEILEERTSYVSRKHATLIRQTTDWYIVDGQPDTASDKFIPSTNGTYVNYRKINGSKGIKLNHGDIITIGDTVLKFTCKVNGLNHD